MNYSSQHSNGNFKSRNKCTKTPTLLTRKYRWILPIKQVKWTLNERTSIQISFPKFHSNETIEMKFDWKNLQISSICSSICSGNSANTSFHMFDWTHFQRKLTISGNSYKLTNEMKFLQSSFISFCLVGIQWGKSICLIECISNGN